MVERFHADPRIKATELLLQERVPRHAPVTQPRPLEATRVATPMAAGRGRAASVRRTRRFRTRTSCRTATTSRSSRNAGGGFSLCRGRAVTRSRRDATCDPRQPVHLPARRSHRVRLVGDRAAHRRRAATTTSSRWRPSARRSAAWTTASRRTWRSPSRPKTTSKCGGSRSPTAATASREIEVTSYAEIVLAHAGRRTSRTRRSASCSSRPNSAAERRRCSAAGGPAASTPTRSGPSTC